MGYSWAVQLRLLQEYNPETYTTFSVYTSTSSEVDKLIESTTAQNQKMEEQQKVYQEQQQAYLEENKKLI